MHICKLVLLALGVLFLGLSLFFLHAPSWVQTMHSFKDVEYPGVEAQEVMEPTCTACTVSGDQTCTSYPYQVTPPTPPQACTPGAGGDAACMVYGEACDSYCTPVFGMGNNQGVCVNGTTKCPPVFNQGIYGQQCRFTSNYESDEWYPYGQQTPQQQEAKATAIMEWWIPNTGGGTVSYVSGMDFYAVSQWISPLFILLILPFVGEWNGPRMILAVVGAFVTAVNVVMVYLRLWILTTIAASIIKPPKWDIGDRSWVYAASGLVVTGTWLMAFAQSVFMLYIVLWFKAQHSDGPIGCETEPLTAGIRSQGYARANNGGGGGYNNNNNNNNNSRQTATAATPVSSGNNGGYGATNQQQVPIVAQPVA